MFGCDLTLLVLDRDCLLDLGCSNRRTYLISLCWFELFVVVGEDGGGICALFCVEVDVSVLSCMYMSSPRSIGSAGRFGCFLGVISLYILFSSSASVVVEVHALVLMGAVFTAVELAGVWMLDFATAEYETPGTGVAFVTASTWAFASL